MKVWLSPYNLELKKTSPTHIATKGALIKFQNDQRDNQIAYSLYHPIESLGDVSLKQLSTSFREMVLNADSLWHSIYQKALKVDTDQEAIDLDVYELCSDLDQINNCISDTVKLKIKGLEDLRKALMFKTSKTLILDCNGQLSIKDYERLSEDEKKSILKNIKYIEDPYRECERPKPPYLKIAADFYNYDDYDFKILKPTAFSHGLKASKNKPNVVTSYLDHPLGLIIAGLWALNHNIDEPCGLGTLNFFEANKYSELIDCKSIFRFNSYPELFKLLETEKWSRLI